MKKISLLIIAIIALLSSACQKETIKPDDRTGEVKIDIGLSISILELDGSKKSAPGLSDFKVIIYSAESVPLMTFENYLEMPDTLELPVGEYFVEAHSDNNLPAAFDNPYYYGKSEMFIVGSNTYHSVEVNCKLSNTIVTVVYSDIIKSSFMDYTTMVATELDSLLFGKDETRMAFFQTSPMEILVELVYQKPDGSEITRSLTGSIPEPLPNHHYEISVDASIDEGMASFQIILDDTEVTIETIQIHENNDTLPDGDIAYGDILITEVMFDPSALSDTEGEWFEIYNNSAGNINLFDLILKRDDTNFHVIGDSITLAPGEFYLFSKTDTASNATNKYIYGSAITLSNTGAVLAIYNAGTETEPGALIFSLDYGDTGFPGGSGKSISLNPALFNPIDAILGTSWCNSISTYNTGDLGTPGIMNDSCQ